MEEWANVVSSCSPETITSFLSSHPSVSIDSKVDSDDNTPLHLLIKEAKDNYLDTIRFLVEKGHPVASPNTDRDTPLHYTSYFNQLEAARVLVEECHHPIQINNGIGKTPSQIASENFNQEIADYLKGKQLALARSPTLLRPVRAASLISINREMVVSPVRSSLSTSEMFTAPPLGTEAPNRALFEDNQANGSRDITFDSQNGSRDILIGDEVVNDIDSDYNDRIQVLKDRVEELESEKEISRLTAVSQFKSLQALQNDVKEKDKEITEKNTMIVNLRGIGLELSRENDHKKDELVRKENQWTSKYERTVQQRDALVKELNLSKDQCSSLQINIKKFEDQVKQKDRVITQLTIVSPALLIATSVFAFLHFRR